MLTEFTDFKRNGTGSIQREIAEFLRRKIVSGKLKPGEKLPSLRKLAELWNTNSFSVNLAMDELTELGFLTKQHGRGVFVTPAKEKIRCIGIYNSCLNSDPRQEVSFQFIQAELCRRLTGMGCSYVIWNDVRPEAEHTVPPDEMSRAIVSGEVQAVAGTLVRNCDKEWFAALPVKKAAMTADRFPEGGWERLAAPLRGRKRPAAIVPVTGNKSFLVESLRDAGVHFTPKRTRMLEEKEYLGKDWTAIGYELAKELLFSPTKPDALLAYPDNLVPGVLYAVYEAGLKVPEDLLLILHRNVELDYCCPFPALYLDTRLSMIAERLANAVTNTPEK